MVYVLTVSCQQSFVDRQVRQVSCIRLSISQQQNNKGSELHGSVRFLGRVPGGPLLCLFYAKLMLSSQTDLLTAQEPGWPYGTSGHF